MLAMDSVHIVFFQTTCLASIADFGGLYDCPRELYEESNAHWKLHLLMKIGGGGEDGPAKGIHWHMNINNTIEYVATDERRLEIPWVKSTHPDGTVKIFRNVDEDFTDEDAAGYESRLMDCIDCHNRPTHHYNPPATLVNRAMSLEQISHDLPGIKWLLVELMSKDYETEDEALAALAEGGINEYKLLVLLVQQGLYLL